MIKVVFGADQLCLRCDEPAGPADGIGDLLMEDETVAVNFSRVHEARGFQVCGEFKAGGVGHKRVPRELRLALVRLVRVVDGLVLRDANSCVPVGRRVIEPVVLRQDVVSVVAQTR